MITKQNFKTIHDVAQLVENGVYEVKIERSKILSENFIFDENKSVKWNKEKVIQTNSENKLKLLSSLDLSKKMKHEMLEDLAIAVSFENNFTNKQSDLIVAKAWIAGHDSGIKEVVSIIEDLVDFITEFNK